MWRDLADPCTQSLAAKQLIEGQGEHMKWLVVIGKVGAQRQCFHDGQPNARSAKKKASSCDVALNVIL